MCLQILYSDTFTAILGRSPWHEPKIDEITVTPLTYLETRLDYSPDNFPKSWGQPLLQVLRLIKARLQANMSQQAYKSEKNQPLNLA